MCYPCNKICLNQKLHIATYALKTPHVVALPFIYGVKCMDHCFLHSRGGKWSCRLDHYFPHSKNGKWSRWLDRCSLMMRQELQRSLVSTSSVYIASFNACRETLLGLWPWPLTYDLDLRTWRRYLRPWPSCQNSSLCVSLFGNGRRHRRTHTDNAKTITPYADAGCNRLGGGYTSYISYIILGPYSWRGRGMHHFYSMFHKIRIWLYCHTSCHTNFSADLYILQWYLIISGKGIHK